ncbi:hypothetical protein WAI453_004127 [Rhynchosporium graminicola]
MRLVDFTLAKRQVLRMMPRYESQNDLSYLLRLHNIIAGGEITLECPDICHDIRKIRTRLSGAFTVKLYMYALWVLGGLVTPLARYCCHFSTTTTTTLICSTIHHTTTSSRRSYYRHLLISRFHYLSLSIRQSLHIQSVHSTSCITLDAALVTPTKILCVFQRGIFANKYRSS